MEIKYILLLVFLLIGCNNCIKYCSISRFMKSNIDIEIISIKTTPKYIINRGQILTTKTKFRLKSGKITSGSFKCAVSFSGMVLYEYDVKIAKSTIGKQLPLLPGIYTFEASKKIPSIAPLGVYSSKTKFYANGKISACFLRNIKIKK